MTDARREAVARIVNDGVGHCAHAFEMIRVIDALLAWHDAETREGRPHDGGAETVTHDTQCEQNLRGTWPTHYACRCEIRELARAHDAETRALREATIEECARACLALIGPRDIAQAMAAALRALLTPTPGAGKMTDPTAAVEAVRARHEADKQHEWPLDHWFEQLQEDRATLLRAYEALAPVPGA